MSRNATTLPGLAAHIGWNYTGGYLRPPVPLSRDPPSQSRAHARSTGAPARPATSRTSVSPSPKPQATVETVIPTGPRAETREEYTAKQRAQEDKAAAKVREAEAKAAAASLCR